MTTIIIKDSLRQSVEAASGGKQTVLYSPKGQATFMSIFEKVDLSAFSDELTGTHPAFIIDGKEVSQLFIGTYQGTIINGELVSQPWATPTNGLLISAYRNAISAMGAGHHLMTMPEWGLVAAYDNTGTQTLGNTNAGSSHLDSTKKGKVIAGQVNQIYTGSGPVEFRLNAKYNGPSDLVGNRFQICDGFRFASDELQIVENNNAAMSGFDLGVNSANWRAINGQTGALITPAYSGAINTDYVATTQNSIRLASATVNADYGIYNLQAKVPTLTGSNQIQPAALKFLRAMGICSISSACTPRGGFNPSRDAVINKDMRVWRSGAPDHGGYASINALYLQNFISPSSSYAAEGGSVRPCYYEV